jgi:hypothetical protein
MTNIFSKKEVNCKHPSKLRYGMIHSLFGDAEGVSIVMKQLEGVLNEKMNTPVSEQLEKIFNKKRKPVVSRQLSKILHLKMGVPKNRIYYLIGKSKVKSKQITESKILWNNYSINLLALENYHKGLNEKDKIKIEKAINLAKEVIDKFVRKNKIDVLISHNSSHPVNFIMSVALSRYFKERKEAGLFVPKYILWWHDSHLERKSFSKPSKDIKKYLIEGLPGPYVDYILFINSGQWENAKNFFKEVDKNYPGFYKKIEKNHDFVYNTTNTFIENYSDLEKNKFGKLVNCFFEDFNIYNLLGNNGLFVEDALFCLQPTRMVHRKRIDFALKFCYSLLKKLKKKGKYKAIYFLISGHDPVGMKKELLELNEKLKTKFKEENVFLVFAEDYYSKTTLKFLDYPKVFAQLGGIATYFSDVEGFGNNLLEVLAAGLPTVIYEYPVYKKDISKSKFKLISFNKFVIDNKRIEKVIKLLSSKVMRKNWVNKNLEILRRDYPHSLVVSKLKKAIYS